MLFLQIPYWRGLPNSVWNAFVMICWICCTHRVIWRWLCKEIFVTRYQKQFNVKSCLLKVIYDWHMYSMTAPSAYGRAFICQLQLLHLHPSASIMPWLILSSLIWLPPVCTHEVIRSLMWSCLALTLMNRSHLCCLWSCFWCKWWNRVYVVLSATILL